MYIQQWQDRFGPLQHHRGFQQNNLEQKRETKSQHRSVSTYPFAVSKSDFKQILYIYNQ